jgi:hypothetical protein
MTPAQAARYDQLLNNQRRSLAVWAEEPLVPDRWAGFFQHYFTASRWQDQKSQVTLYHCRDCGQLRRYTPGMGPTWVEPGVCPATLEIPFSQIGPALEVRTALEGIIRRQDKVVEAARELVEYPLPLGPESLPDLLELGRAVHALEYRDTYWAREHQEPRVEEQEA